MNTIKLGRLQLTHREREQHPVISFTVPQYGQCIPVYWHSRGVAPVRCNLFVVARAFVAR
jgi:hypothetical protein